jgi:hypothetical protein
MLSSAIHNMHIRQCFRLLTGASDFGMRDLSTTESQLSAPQSGRFLLGFGVNRLFNRIRDIRTNRFDQPLG